MINTTDFLDALRNFEYVAKQDFPKEFKVQAKKKLLNKLIKLEADICDVNLGDYPELIGGTYQALKNL